jgi:hypothetical protein
LEISGAFLDEEVIVWNIAVDDATYVTQDVKTGNHILLWSLS